MLVLTIVFLVGLYIVKIFFPQEFVMAIENPTLISIGDYIDNNKWAYYLANGITAFITYWLYCCAVCGKKYLKWYECLFILIPIVSIRVIELWDINIAVAINWTSFAFLPALMKGSNLKNCAIVFTCHTLLQCISLTIRNFSLYLTTINYITTFIFGIESFLWLILFYIIFNYKNKKEIE